MRYTFPAIFEQDEHGVSVTFPDDATTITCGRTIEEATDMATDALNLTLYTYEQNGTPIPVPTPLADIKLTKSQTVRLIEADTTEYGKILEQISNNPIRYAREQAGFTIKELAEYLDAPYRTIQDWNAGKSRPPRWIENILFNYILSAK